MTARTEASAFGRATPPRYYAFLLAALLAMAGWVDPNHYHPWTAFHNEFLAALALLCLSTGGFSSGTRATTEVPRSAAFVALIALVPPLQFLGGKISFGGDAGIVSLYLAGLALAIVTGYRLAETPVQRRQLAGGLAWLFLTGTLVSLFLALHQWLQTDRLGMWVMYVEPGGRPFANLGQPNNLGTLFGLGLASLLYLRETTRLGTAVAALLSALVLFGIALTGSRTSMLIVLALALGLLLYKHRLSLKHSYWEIAIGLILFVGFIQLLPQLSELLLLSPGESGSRLADTSSGQARLDKWSVLMEALSKQPLLGYGWNHVSTAHVAAVVGHTQSGLFEYSHNLLLDLIVWNGIIIGGALIGAMAIWLVHRIRQCRDRESWFGLLALAAIGVHSMLEMPHAYTYFLFPAGLFVGMLERGVVQTSYRATGWILPGVLIVAWLFTFWVYYEYRQLEEDHRRLRFDTLYPSTAPTQSDSRPLLLTQLSEFIWFARTEAAPGMDDDELQRMARVVYRYPYAPALFRYALALALNGRNREAEQAFRQLESLYPERRAEARENWIRLFESYPDLKNLPRSQAAGQHS